MIDVKTMTTHDLGMWLGSARENNLSVLERMITVELSKRNESMVGKNKPGPKPRKREPGVKLMTLPLECSNEEMQEFLELLDAKVGTNNSRKRYEWLRDAILKGGDNV